MRTRILDVSVTCTACVVRDVQKAGSTRWELVNNLLTETLYSWRSFTHPLYYVLYIYNGYYLFHLMIQVTFNSLILNQRQWANLPTCSRGNLLHIILASLKRCIRHMRVPLCPIRRAGSWGYLAGSWRKTTPIFISI